MPEWATYKQTAYLRRCIEALKNEYKISAGSAAHSIGVTLPLSDNTKDKASRAIKAAHYKLTGSTKGTLKEYWRAKNAGNR